MPRLSRRIVIMGSVAAVATPALAAQAPVFTPSFSSAAIWGYDPVAYFTESRPVKGSRAFTAQYNGANWRFASAANRDAFNANPQRFAPQYGGYCAWAVSQGHTAKTDPKAWRIVDGKLYLNFDKTVQTRWERDIPGNIRKGDANWPRVLN